MNRMPLLRSYARAFLWWIIGGMRRPGPRWDAFSPESPFWGIDRSVAPKILVPSETARALERELAPRCPVRPGGDALTDEYFRATSDWLNRLPTAWPAPTSDPGPIEGLFPDEVQIRSIPPRHAATVGWDLALLPHPKGK